MSGDGTGAVHVLFMCPHAAAKSVLAATYFRDAASRLGVAVTAAVAGTDPDDAVNPRVAAVLREQGFTVTDRPRRVIAEDADADILVSLGCTLRDLPRARAVIEWDVPMVSEDVQACAASVRVHAAALAADLARARPGGT